MYGNSVICSRALEVTDAGSLTELSTTDKMEDESSGRTEPLSIEPVPRTSGAVVTEERTSELVIEGNSVVGLNAEVESATASVLATGMSVMASELIVVVGSSLVSSATPVGIGSGPIVELSAVEGTIEEVSWAMELATRMLVSAVCDTDVDGSRLSGLVLDGKSVTEGKMEDVSRVGSPYVADGVRASD